MRTNFTSDKEVNRLINEKVKEGWSCEVSKKIKLRHPLGGMVSLSMTPSCRHALNQILRDIKKLENSHRKMEIAS